MDQVIFHMVDGEPHPTTGAGLNSIGTCWFIFNTNSCFYWLLSNKSAMRAQWENECISLSVLSMTRVMIAQWENEWISRSVLSAARVQLPATAEYLQGIFPWLIALCQPVLSQRDRKWLNLPSVASHNLWTLRRKAEAQPWLINWGMTYCGINT